MQKKSSPSVIQNLLWVDLPLADGLPPQRVLVLAVGLAQQRTRIILSDLDNQLTERTVIGANIGEEYNPSFVDKLGTFLDEHVELRQQLTVEGAAAHGPLTLARAVHFAREEGHSVDVALAMAIDQSVKCRDYQARLLDASAPHFASPAA